MADDLISNRLTGGTRWADIERDLGEPDETLAGQRLADNLDIASKGGIVLPGDTLYSYEIINSPPFPESYTTYVRILVRNGRIVAAWRADGA